jgi:hypothetical protein
LRICHLLRLVYYSSLHITQTLPWTDNEWNFGSIVTGEK